MTFNIQPGYDYRNKNKINKRKYQMAKTNLYQPKK